MTAARAQALATPAMPAPSTPPVDVSVRAPVRPVSARARLLLQLIDEHADADGVYTRRLGQLAAELDVSTAAVTKLLSRLASDGIELRVPYGVGRDGRPIYATPGRPYRLRRPSTLAAAEARADSTVDSTVGRRVDNRPPSYPQTAGQARVDNCPACGQRVDNSPPSADESPGQARVDNCPPYPPSSKKKIKGSSGNGAPDGAARRPSPGAVALAGDPPDGRHTYADGTAVDWDPPPAGPTGRGAAYYRCRTHAAQLTVADGPGPSCPRCAAVRVARTKGGRRKAAQPPPGQQPLVAAISGGPGPPTAQLDGDDLAAIAACQECNHLGRLPGGRWCHHDPEAAARSDTRRAEARAVASRRRRGRTS